MKKITIIKGCFGEDILIDDVDYEEFPQEQITAKILKELQENEHFRKETFLKLCWNTGDSESIYHNSCEQCGDWNSKTEITLFEDGKQMD